MKQLNPDDLSLKTQEEIITIQNDIVDYIESLIWEYGAPRNIPKEINDFLVMKNTDISLRDLIWLSLLFNLRIKIDFKSMPPTQTPPDTVTDETS